MDKELLDMLWVIIASGLVFLMQPGFAALESGLTRSKNSINVAVKNITDLVVAVMLFWIFGYALMFGASHFGLWGGDKFMFAFESDASQASFFLFQSMFVATAATIVSGAIAERASFSSYIIITILISGLIYPVYGHWVWKSGDDGSGWLAALGFVDFAGSTVVHSVGGWVALAAVLILGPRTNRFTDDGRSQKIQGHDLPIAILGTLLLFFGWFGFNGGSTLAMSKDVAVIILNTVLAGVSGAVFSLLLGWSISKKAEVSFLINGTLAGLVAITANCHAVSTEASVLIGGIGGVIAYSLERLLDYLKIDDVIGAFPVHTGGGIWGTLAVALFGDPKLLGTGQGMGEQLLTQLIGVVAAGIWAFGIGYLLLYSLNKIIPIRVSAEHEKVGLNIAEHGASTEIIDLFQKMDEQERTGDLSLRLPVEPFTEIGQIADKFNRVMGALYRSQRERTAIMENVSQGLFILNRDGTIAPGYSNAFENIIKKSDLAQKGFSSIMTGILSSEKLESFGDYVELMLNSSHAESDLSRLNPLRKVKAEVGGEFIYINIEFRRIVSDNQVEHLLGSVTDITESVKLEMELKANQEKSKKEMEKLFQIIHVNADELIAFVGSVRGEIEAINSTLAKNQNQDRFDESELRKMLTRIFSSLHAIKGEAAILSIDFMADAVHAYEERLQSALSKDEITTEDFLPILFMVTGIERDLNEIVGFIERLQSFNSALAQPGEELTEKMMQRLQNKAISMAEELKKEVNFNYSLLVDKLLPEKYFKLIKDSLIQLVRNSVVHGIEEPHVRLERGKEAAGRIEFTLEEAEEGYQAIYRDDGAGLNLTKIREKALKQGLLTPDEADRMEGSQMARLIFEPSFSTSEEESMSAGRGVGMDVIRRSIKSLGGKLNVSFAPGKYFQMKIVLPP